ncbi:MAG: PLDc N-terminal domain-containing protein [Candidatus Izimaplasma sp.]|nr:PLDc N-terminal domain-containing protein [Candidatus Izimaplasma bacterium]
MEGLETIIDLLPLLIPLILIDLSIRIYAIVDIVKPNRIVTINNNKTVWILISVLVNFGGLIYLLFGRSQ